MIDFVQRTIDLAMKNVDEGGRPFACVIARNGAVVAEAPNLVVQTKDPTAHAEIVAIRKASAILGTEHFDGCEFFILAHPCPMCLGALYYCSPDRVTFITAREEYASYYVDDRRWFDIADFYSEISKPWQERRMPMAHAPHPDGILVYRRWKELNQP